MESMSILHWRIVIVSVVGVIVPFRALRERVLSLIVPIFSIHLVERSALALKSGPGVPQAVRS